MAQLVPYLAVPEAPAVSSVSLDKDAQFSYPPLKEQQIRLIELLPAAKSSPIECKIIPASLDDESQPYECLSYMWGPPTLPQSISMDGKSVKVGENLGAALKAIRDESKPRVVWIDALCINQHDVHERNQQVAIMGQIYQGAIKVLVWLGEAADESDILFEHIVHQDQWYWEWTGPLNHQYEKAMLAFYCRPYWRRVWVIQELLSAKSVHLFCGNKSMEYFMFHSGYCSFRGKMEELEKGGKTPPGCTHDPWSDFYHAPGCRILSQRGMNGTLEVFSILRLLELCADCRSDCKLVHDRIYGLIGLLKSSQLGSIIPDYSKTLSELYINVLISLLIPDSAQDSHYISIWGSIGKDLIESTRIVQRLLEDPLWDIKADNFHPLGSICSALQLEKMKNLRFDVWMEGVGVISKVGDALTPEEFLNEDKDRFCSVVDATENERFRASLKGLNKRDFYITQNIGTRYMKKLVDQAIEIFDVIEDRSNTTHKNVHARSNGINRPFRTKNGVLGLASSAIQKGDLLYGFMALEGLFLGSDSLFLVIRPGSDPSIHSFSLIGRAILLPVPKTRFSDLRTQKRRGRFQNFHFKGDLYTEGITLDEEAFEEIDCYMDAITLFLLTR